MFSPDGAQLPIPQPDGAYREAVRRANERFREAGKRGSVLLEMQINERGAVTSAWAIDPPRSFASPIPQAVLRDSEGNQLPGPPPRTQDPELRRAAEELARLLRFRPAERGGVPVATSGFRMSISFG
jgi:outer membrane biosynthesis protein TonB